MANRTEEQKPFRSQYFGNSQGKLDNSPSVKPNIMGLPDFRSQNFKNKDFGNSTKRLAPVVTTPERRSTGDFGSLLHGFSGDQEASQQTWNTQGAGRQFNKIEDKFGKWRTMALAGMGMLDRASDSVNKDYAQNIAGISTKPSGKFAGADSNTGTFNPPGMPEKLNGLSGIPRKSVSQNTRTALESAMAAGGKKTGTMSWGTGKDKQTITIWRGKDGKENVYNSDGTIHDFHGKINQQSEQDRNAGEALSQSYEQKISDGNQQVQQDQNGFDPKELHQKLNSIESQLAYSPDKIDLRTPEGIAILMKMKNLKNQRDNIYGLLGAKVTASGKENSGNSFQEKVALNDRKHRQTMEENDRQNLFESNVKVFDLVQEKNSTESEQAYKARLQLAKQKNDAIQKIISEGNLTIGSPEYIKAIAAIDMQFDNAYKSLIGSNTGSKNTGEVDITDPNNPKNQKK